MSTDIIAYLDNEIMSKKRCVTFRSLSRGVSIHVNEAKNKLAEYYSTKRGSSAAVFAVYQISGESSAGTVPFDGNAASSEEVMDVDENDDGIERRLKVVITDENQLDRTTLSFRAIHSCHIYSLSPTPITRKSLKELLSPLTYVREVDASRGDDFSGVVGRVVSPLVNHNTVVGSANKSSVMKTAQPAGPSRQVKNDPRPAPAASPAGNPKTKATGRLEWAKAKPKGDAGPSSVKLEPNPSARIKEAKANSTGDIPPELKSLSVTGENGRTEKRQRQPKAKSPPVTNPSQRTVPAYQPSEQKRRISSSGRIENGAILSDDEDTDADRSTVRPAKRNGKAKLVESESEAERSVRAIMDIDDSEVVKVLRPSASHTAREDTSADEGPSQLNQANDAMDDDDAAPSKPRPRKRKENKAIPVGRNGLKKRRVVKSRMTTDAKGYMVTEDYSSYESVDEEEPDEPPKPKVRARAAPAKAARAKPAKRTSAASDSDDTQPRQDNALGAAAPNKRPAPTASGRKSLSTVAKGNSGQSNLMNFFGGGARGKR